MKKQSRRWLSFLTTLCLLGGITFCGSVATEEVVLGEVDGREGINASDALLVLQSSVNLVTLSEEENQAADVNADGQVNATDALMILQYSVGLIHKFEADASEYRVLLASDIHCTHLAEWYGVSNEERMQAWVDAVLDEHARQQIDLLLLLGDYSLDHWEYGGGGSWLNENKSTTEQFFRDYVSQLPEEIEIFSIAGNHEQFGDEKWFEITGNHRTGSVLLGDNLFIMLDTFGANLDPSVHSDGTYQPADVEFIRQQMEQYPYAKVYLCAHYFDVNAESYEFQDVLFENRVMGLFMGHTHLNTVENYVWFGLKPLAQTGNFSYTNGDSLKDSFWGFRDLVITSDGAESNYIVAASEAVVNGERLVVKRHFSENVKFY